MRLRTPATVLLSAISLCISACASGNNAPPDAPPAAQPPQLSVGSPVRLSPGSRARFSDGSMLTFQSVVTDSRCKPDVQCVWAGDAEARFTLTGRAGDETVFSLHTGLQPRSKTLASGTLYLEDVDWNSPPGVQVVIK